MHWLDSHPEASCHPGQVAIDCFYLELKDWPSNQHGRGYPHGVLLYLTNVVKYVIFEGV